MKPTFTDAKARAVVVLADGRSARLVSLPGPRRRKTGARARVQLPSGAFLSVPVDSIVLADEAVAS